jgi:alpha-tubulin suppressor-like RCC1 family protein
MTIIFRKDKGYPLTYPEMDENFRDILEDTDLARVTENGATANVGFTANNVTTGTLIRTRAQWNANSFSVSELRSRTNQIEILDSKIRGQSLAQVSANGSIVNTVINSRPEGFTEPIGSHRTTFDQLQTTIVRRNENNKVYAELNMTFEYTNPNVDWSYQIEILKNGTPILKTEKKYQYSVVTEKQKIVENIVFEDILSESTVSYVPVIYIEKDASLIEPVQLFTGIVTNNGTTDWSWSVATDRNGGVSGNDPVITIYEGDTLVVTNNASASHPFYIKTAAVTGTGSQASNVSNNGGSAGGVITWVTQPGDAGTYYYQCGTHAAMVGTITVLSNTQGTEKILDISTGYETASIAIIRSPGTLWCWGANEYGQLGTGDTAFQSSPVQVGTDTNWDRIEINGRACIALKTDGTIWTWGGTVYGNTSSPVQVGTNTDWKYITLSKHGSTIWNNTSFFAANTNNYLFSWGDNFRGKLGLNDVVNRPTPTEVPGISSVICLEATDYGLQPGVALTRLVSNNDQLYAWGYNLAGRFGISSASFPTNAYRSAPVNLSRQLVPTNHLSASFYMGGDEVEFFDRGIRGITELSRYHKPFSIGGSKFIFLMRKSRYEYDVDFGATYIFTTCAEPHFSGYNDEYVFAFTDSDPAYVAKVLPDGYYSSPVCISTYWYNTELDLNAMSLDTGDVALFGGPYSLKHSDVGFSSVHTGKYAPFILGQDHQIYPQGFAYGSNINTNFGMGNSSLPWVLFGSQSKVNRSRTDLSERIIKIETSISNDDIAFLTDQGNVYVWGELRRSVWRTPFEELGQVWPQTTDVDANGNIILVYSSSQRFDIPERFLDAKSYTYSSIRVERATFTLMEIGQ